MNAFICYCATKTTSVGTISTSPACREIHFRAQKYEKSSYKYCIVSFFSLQALPASSQHAASAIAPRCITHRTALHRPPHRTAPNAAPLPTICLTPPSTPFHHPAALSPAPSSHPPQCPSAHAPWHFLRFQSLLCPISHRVRNIYIMCRKQNCTFFKKKGHNALPICQIALPLQSQNGNKGCQARQNTPGSTLDA